MKREQERKERKRGKRDKRDKEELPKRERESDLGEAEKGTAA